MPHSTSTINIFAAFQQLNVLIIGDVMIDRYLRGRVDRISPEAPVPVVQWTDTEDRLGGAANVALNIRALGATPHLLTVIGDDDNGRRLADLLPEQELSADGLIISAYRPTTIKTRILAGSQQLLRVDHEVKHPLNDTEAEELISRLHTLLARQPIDIIIFQDYNKGVLSASVIQRVMALAQERQIPTAVDPKQDNFWAYRGATLFKPNLREMQQQTDFAIQPTLGDLDRAAKRVTDQLANQFTLITLSEHGLYLRQEADSQIYPTRRRTIADVCGAGDTVISVAAAALAIGLPPARIATLANLAGGQVCERVGVVPLDVAQLEKEWHEEVAGIPTAANLNNRK